MNVDSNGIPVGDGDVGPCFPLCSPMETKRYNIFNALRISFGMS